MKEWLLVGGGGFLGAVLRSACTGFAVRLGCSAAAATLAVNAAGCLVAGGLWFAAEAGAVGPRARAFLAVGLLAAFTTFSTFGVDTLELARARGLGPALANVAGHLLLGLGGVALGYALARAWAA